jgi:CRISPR/Cas system CSM-associated protein Csm4 (group 5 of RAMP superfamily)
VNLQTYLMEARSAFHFGEVGLDVEQAGEYAAADRLFSALCATIQMLSPNRHRMAFARK